ncbi:hypothetical protein A1353_09905 [Methylomonas methanica]|uniref:Uncharacterized protein n=1 Tax=Methylomonas methanica TaxID=421 RepID=A0A177MJK8_METMH|nr:hypothetical protein A1353_09905 [Methylomonas methanica]
MAYIFSIKVLNQRGRSATTYIPIKQPGETGPKPMIANRENTARHFIWDEFIKHAGYEIKFKININSL